MKLSIILALILALPSFAWSQAEFTVTSQDFLQAVNERMFKVAELKKLHDYGKEHGLRIWAAGGSAAGLAHYIKMDLEREWRIKNGLPAKYFTDRFAYNYYDIFRSTQDADIVIDGTEAQAQALEQFLSDSFPYLKGSKKIWEVRLLRESRGTGTGKKDSLTSSSFLNQNSDSHSTGMIEITDPSPIESRVRDLYELDNQTNPPFLIDVLSGELHYYRNRLHKKTERFMNGFNPEILSVIRYFTKAFQYGVKIRKEDEQALQEIIHDFNPSVKLDPYAQGQVESNGLKLFWHSQDVENSWNVLEKFGLRKKLIEFARIHQQKEFADWLDREPLRSTQPDRRKGGKTAGELGIKIVAHETNSYLAYENITRSLYGKPNVFQSRKGYANEAALYGDGFYTRIGKEGARGTKLTIRYQVDPEAREGVDFILGKGTDYVIWLNGSALSTIDDSLVLTPLQFFEILNDDQSTLAQDRGVLQKLELKVSSKMSTISVQEKAEISKIIQNAISDFLNAPSIFESAVLQEWFARPELVKSNPKLLKDFIGTCLMRMRDQKRNPNSCIDAIKIAGILDDERHSELIEFAFNNVQAQSNGDYWQFELTILQEYFGNSEHALKHYDYEKFLKRLILKSENSVNLIDFNFLTKIDFVNHPEWGNWITYLYENTRRSVDLRILTETSLIQHPLWPKWASIIRMKHSKDFESNNVLNVYINTAFLNRKDGLEMLDSFMDTYQDSEGIQYPEKKVSELTGYFIATIYEYMTDHPEKQKENYKHFNYISIEEQLVNRHLNERYAERDILSIAPVLYNSKYQGMSWCKKHFQEKFIPYLTKLEKPIEMLYQYELYHRQPLVWKSLFLAIFESRLNSNKKNQPQLWEKTNIDLGKRFLYGVQHNTWSTNTVNNFNAMLKQVGLDKEYQFFWRLRPGGNEIYVQRGTSFQRKCQRLLTF